MRAGDYTAISTGDERLKRTLLQRLRDFSRGCVSLERALIGLNRLDGRRSDCTANLFPGRG